MKVSNSKPGGTQASKLDGPKSARGSEAAQGLKQNLKSGGVNPKGDAKVDVSERAQMMQKAKDIAGDSTVDEAKVARFQKLIDEGKYKVDSDKVADRLVDEHLLIPD